VVDVLLKTRLPEAGWEFCRKMVAALPQEEVLAMFEAVSKEIDRKLKAREQCGARLERQLLMFFQARTRLAARFRERLGITQVQLNDFFTPLAAEQLHDFVLGD
jgi:hypothetical protein